MNQFMADLYEQLTEEDIKNYPFLYDDWSLDMEVEKYCLENDIIYYVFYDEKALEALDHDLKREYISELYNELNDFKNLSPLIKPTKKELIISLIKKYKIFCKLTQSDYHSRFGDYFSVEDMRLIKSKE